MVVEKGRPEKQFHLVQGSLKRIAATRAEEMVQIGCHQHVRSLAMPLSRIRKE